MKLILKSILLLAIFTAVESCNSGKKENDGTLAHKKAELAQLKTEYSSMADKIKLLETEMAGLDTNAAKNINRRLVAVGPALITDFSHYIDLQGHIDADNISYIGPRNQGGQVKSVFISKGQVIKKGQLVLKLDDRIYLEQIETVKTQLSFAKDIYQRRQNLWKQGIGSEVELLASKNNVDQLERQLAALKESWSMTNIYSDVNGVVDELNVRVGEMFTGAGAMGPQIRVVNTSSLKVVADIPENYMTTVGKGSSIVVNIADINKTYNAKITFTGASINSNTRGFTVEAKLPYDGMMKPNMLATLKILDYSAPNAVTIPVNLVQTDESGKYVFVMAAESGRTVARKKEIVMGQVYGDRAEVKKGLEGTEQLITEGYQGLYDGQSVSAGN